MGNREETNKSIKRHIATDDLVFVERDTAILIIDRMIDKGLINEDRTVKQEKIEELIEKHNEIAEEYFSTEDQYFIKQSVHGKRTYNSILKMLFDIKNGVYDGSYCPKRKSLDSLLTALFPKYKSVAVMQRSWSCGIEVHKVDSALRTDLLYSGKWLDGDQILNIISSLQCSIQSLLVTNPMVLLFLADFIRNKAPNLQKLWIYLPDIENNPLFEMLSKEREEDLFEQKERYRHYQKCVQSIIHEFGDSIDIQVCFFEKILQYSTLLVVANIDISSGDYGSCISACTTDALYAERCECHVKQKGDRYISRRVELAIS